jgi:hypothetical protein
VNILYSTHTSPDYMPPLAVSERQIIVGPNYPDRIERDGYEASRPRPGRTTSARWFHRFQPIRSRN